MSGESENSQAAYVTLPVGLYDQMARVYYLYRAGSIIDKPDEAQPPPAGVGTQSKVSDLEPARDVGATVDEKIRVTTTAALRPGVPEGYQLATEEELNQIGADEDAARNGHPDASEGLEATVRDTGSARKT